MSVPVSSFKDRLKELLEMRNMKQIDLVKLTQENAKTYGKALTRSMVSRYLSGEYEPNSSNIVMIAELLEVSEAWLLGFDVPMRKDNTRQSLDNNKQSLSDPLPSNLTQVSIVNVPILGTIACGEPILADENIDEYYPMVAELLPKGNTFLLRAYGDSMYPKIEEGDLVLIREQPTVENGEIACVLVNGDTEATLKRVKYQGDMIMLVPDNKNYDPIVVTPEMEVRIVGKAINIISVA